MKQITILIGNNEYPYVETMGAMLSFKEEFGIEASAIEAGNIEQNLQYMYHVVRSACHRQGIPFDMSFEEFCDNLEGLEYTRVRAEIARRLERVLKGDSDEKNA